MNIKVVSIRSLLANRSVELDNFSNSFLSDIKNANKEFNFIDNEEKNILFLIETGGTEEFFRRCYKNYKEPYYLLTNGNNNSLAASLEILTFLNSKGLKGEIIHGDINYVADRIYNIFTVRNAFDFMNNKTLGVIGKPSDWLIASDVDYLLANKKLGINIIDISIEELKSEINKNRIDDPTLLKRFDNKYSNKDTLIKALEIYSAIKRLVRKYRLSGLTIRCFDLLGIYKNTSCLALALLNEEGIISSCEGDVPTLITMFIVKALTNKSSFQANPSRINLSNNTMILAHCTVPFDMCRDYEFDTHFESQLGIGVRGVLNEENITLVKLKNDFSDIIVSEGKIIKNLNEKSLCRTQIEVSLKMDLNRFFTKPLGNHQVIMYGDYVNLFTSFFNEIK